MTTMLLDQSKYKDLRTTRGYKYHYYYAAAADDKPTLLLLHGFPTNSLDWSSVVSYFTAKGFGAIAPDLLGYAGTDKPTDPKEYRMKLMVQDVIEILDHEKPKRLISIAHDWGCGLNARLVTYNEDRFDAFAFFAIPYSPPAPFDLEAINKAAKAILGYDNFGYWNFFAKEEAAKIIEDNFDRMEVFMSCSDIEAVKDNFCREGGLERFLTSKDPITFSTSEPANPEKAMSQLKSLKEGGLTAPLCWYKAMTQGHTPADYNEIPEERYNIKKPVFFGAALKDPTGPHQFTKPSMEKYCEKDKLTIVDFETSHWVLDEAPEKVNAELEKWFESLKLAKL